MKPFSNNQLRDYSSLFLRNEAKAWFKKDFKSITCKIDRYDQDWRLKKDCTYIGYLKHVYRVLEQNYANEYILKNTFLNECLIGEIASHDANVFSEFRIGDAVADLAAFNGSSKVFEIKTELDSDNRLASQLHNYKKAFNEIYLIVPEAKLLFYSKYEKEAGLISYNLRNEKKFIIERYPIANYVVESDAIMNLLHTAEYKALIWDYFGEVGKMTSFNQFETCKVLLRKIPVETLNFLFITFMKKRKTHLGLSKKSNKEFNQLSLALKLDNQQRSDLMESLNTLITQ